MEFETFFSKKRRLDISTKDFSILEFSNYYLCSIERLKEYSEKMESIMSQLRNAFEILSNGRIELFQIKEKWRREQKIENISSRLSKNNLMNSPLIQNSLLRFEKDFERVYISDPIAIDIWKEKSQDIKVITLQHLNNISSIYETKRLKNCINENKISESNNNLPKFQLNKTESPRDLMHSIFTRKEKWNLNIDSTSSNSIQSQIEENLNSLLEIEILIRKLLKRILFNLKRLSGSSSNPNVGKSNSIDIESAVRDCEFIIIELFNEKTEIINKSIDLNEIEKLKKLNKSFEEIAYKRETKSIEDFYQKREKLDKLESIITAQILRRKIEFFIIDHIYPQEDYQFTLKLKGVKQSFESALQWLTGSPPFNLPQNKNFNSSKSKEIDREKKQDVLNRNYLWSEFEKKFGMKTFPKLRNQFENCILTIFDRVQYPNISVKIGPQNFGDDIVSYEVFKVILTMFDDESYPKLEWKLLNEDYFRNNTI